MHRVVPAEPVSRLETLEQRCVAISRRLAIVAVAGMLVLSLLTIIDITLRYFLSAPLQGLDEATQLIMAVIISASLPAGIATRNHVTIDFFRNFIGPRWEAVMAVIGGALVLLLMMLLAWRFGAYAQRLMLRDDATMIVGIPTAPFWWGVTGMLALCVPIQIIVLLNLLHTAWQRLQDQDKGTSLSATLTVILGLTATAAMFFVIIQYGARMSAGALAAITFIAMWIPIGLMVPVGIIMAFSGIIGAPYHRIFPRAVRNHLYLILRALQVDLIFVEDGVGFRRFCRVLRMMFEIYDVYGGRRRADELHFTGVPGVRVMIHEYQLDEPFRSEVYPEPDYENLGRARILHIFKDRGEQDEPLETPQDFTNMPMPSAAL